MSDREIAEDLLVGQKYLSNYYYAPAILEAGDPAVRSSFQEVHSDSASAAKSVFDYLQAKGWYQARRADEQDISDLRNAVNQSRQVTQSENTIGGNEMSMNQGQQNWTGTQSMEGQSGFGPSSLSQGAHFGGEPSMSSGFGGQYQGAPQQANLPTWARGGFGYQQGGVGQQGAIGSQGWTGTQSMEGQSGYGPSSLSQGVRYGGEPSLRSGFGGQYQGAPQQANLPTWARGGFGYQQGIGQQGGIGSQGWTGTQSMEGQSGYGPSSLSQGTRYGGEPSLGGGFGGQYQYQGAPQQVNLPTWARGGFGGQQGGFGQQGSFGGQQVGMGGPSAHTWRSSLQSGNTGWTGTQAGEGQSGYGPSSLGNYGTANYQVGQGVQRQGWNMAGQGNYQSQ